MRIDQKNDIIDTIILDLFSDPETLMDVNEILSSISIPEDLSYSLHSISIFDIQDALNRLVKKQALEYSVINNQYYSTDCQEEYEFHDISYLEESLKNKKVAFSKKAFFKDYCNKYKVIYSDKFINKVFANWINKGLIKETSDGKYEKV